MKAAVRKVIERTLPAPLYDWLRLRHMRAQRGKFTPRVVQHQYGGRRYQMTLADPVGADWYDHDWGVLPELELLGAHRLKPGARAFDIGAHQGLVAMMLSDAVGPSGQVVAVEASPFNARLADQNRELNGLGQMRVIQAAVSDRPGRLTLNEDSNGQVDGTGRLGRIDVESRTIDDLAREFGMPDVLLIDIEGFECTALRGAAQVLASRPDCFVEVHVGAGLEKFGGSVETLISLFPAESYRYWVRGDREGERFREVDRDYFSSGEPLLKERFFLVLTAKGDS